MVGFGSKSSVSMELTLGPRRRSPRLLDLISALPDDLLLLILARLPCASAAARTGVLSRRWRGLWASLRRIVFRDVRFHNIEPALARVSRPPPAVSLLEIRLPEPRGRVIPGQRARVPREQLVERADLESLLRAAALLQPEEFFLVVPSGLVDSFLVVDLLCLHRATSIVLDLKSFGAYRTALRVLAGLEFPALETLSLSHCSTDYDALLSCCPRLRTLRLDDNWFPKGVLRVNSPSLQELLVAGATVINHLSIVAPMLTQLTMSLHSSQDVNISILAPMMEKVSWDCYFSKQSSAFGLWRLLRLILQVAEKQGQPHSLQIHAFIDSSATVHGEVANFTQEIERRLIAAFSALELRLKTKGHVYGAFVSHVLKINQIRCAMQRLKLDLRRPLMEEEGCPPDCPCEPTDWKSQTISLTALEEVEISGFGGKDHDLDLLKLILRSAPILKRMTMKLSQEASASNDGCTEVYNIFKAYSSVQCYVYLSSGSKLSSSEMNRGADL